MPKVGKMEYAKIYKIVDNITGKCYIGSTTERLLSRRLTKHVAHYKAWKNGKFCYVTSFEILRNNDYYIELLQARPDCKSIDELRKIERYHIDIIPCVNKYVPSRTGKEYMKQYRELNKEKIKIISKDYNENNKEKIAEQKKQYYENNKDKLLKKQKLYDESNKDKIRAKHTCECGGNYTTKHRHTHNKSNKHKRYYRNLFMKIEDQEIQYTYDDVIETQLYNQMIKNFN